MRIGFVGVGRIAADIVEGLCGDEQPGDSICLSPRNREVSARLAACFPCVTVAADNQAVVDSSEVVFLSVLPRSAPEVLSQLHFRAGQLLICLAAMTPVAEAEALAAPATVVRAVPQPSARRRLSPTILYPDNPRARDIFDRLGRTIVLDDEDTFRAVEAVTGMIKPLYMVLGEVSRWMTRHGVSESEAVRFVLDEFRGALELAAEAGAPDLEEHSAAAATKGGLNHQATEYLRGVGSFEDFACALDEVLVRINRQSREVWG